MAIKDIFKNNIFSRYQQVVKQSKILMDGILRPIGSLFSGTGNVLVYPPYPWGRNTLYELSYSSDTMTTIHNALRRELFRNGYDLVEADNTDEEVTTSEEEISAQGVDRKEILDFLEDINENDQSLIDVLMELEDDFSIMDDAYMMFINDYAFNTAGKLLPKETQVSQILRVDPRVMGLVMNRYDRPGYNDDNETIYTCVDHRHDQIIDKDRCPKCGKECFPVHFFTDYGGKKLYYFKNEIIHRSKYRPSKRFGYPPTLAAWQKTRTLTFMDKYVMDLYTGQRPPKSGLFFRTSNEDSLRASYEKAKKNANENPHLPWIMGVPGTGDGKGFVEYIDFMKGLDELQHTEMRNEYRQVIGAVYGVEPVYQGDNSMGGGLNNEGLQITVTNRAVEFGQFIYNSYFLPKVPEAKRAQGWSLRLNPSEEQDQMAKLQRQAQTLQNGQMALSLGLDAEYDDATGEISIKSGGLEMQEIDFGSDPFSGNDGSQAQSKVGSPTTKAATSSTTGFTKISKAIREEIDKIIKKFNRKPTEEELSEAIGKINLRLKSEMKESTQVAFKKIYQTEADKIAKSMGINAVFDTVDENALIVLANQQVLSDAYEGLASGLTKKLNDVIVKAYRTPGGLSIDKITKDIQEAVKITDGKARNIARTETSKVSSAARNTTYRKERDFDTFKFRHLGPSDHRTTQTSKNITARTKGGVVWEEYVKIVEEESAKEFPKWTVNKDFPVSHYSSRHSFVRIQG